MTSGPRIEQAPSNREIAAYLDRVAGLLAGQGATPFRVQAYRKAAALIRELPVSVTELYRDAGVAGLITLRHVGPGIAAAIQDLLLTGRPTLLERLRGDGNPSRLLATVPGIGTGLAERLHHELGIATLEELELAAHDGRLARLRGFGPKRIAGIREALATRLSRWRWTAAPLAPPPPVAELLEVDAEYRERARAGTLPRIAPRRFNPERRAWLPVLHTQRGTRHYTALFSNTVLAHRLGRTRDWVVIYSDGPTEQHQATVVTATSGPLAGRRVVRGRETECQAHYQRAGHSSSSSKSKSSRSSSSSSRKSSSSSYSSSSSNSSSSSSSKPKASS